MTSHYTPPEGTAIRALWSYLRDTYGYEAAGKALTTAGVWDVLSDRGGITIHLNDLEHAMVEDALAALDAATEEGFTNWTHDQIESLARRFHKPEHPEVDSH